MTYGIRLVAFEVRSGNAVHPDRAEKVGRNLPSLVEEHDQCNAGSTACKVCHAWVASGMRERTSIGRVSSWSLIKRCSPMAPCMRWKWKRCVCNSPSCAKMHLLLPALLCSNPSSKFQEQSQDYALMQLSRASRSFSNQCKQNRCCAGGT